MLGVIAVLSLDPTSKDGLKNITSIGVAIDAAVYYSLFVGSPALDPSLLTFGSAVIAAILLLRVMLFAADPLETLKGRWPPEPRFFQANYASRYLLRRCHECVAPHRCGDRPLNEENREHVPLWYELFNSLRSDDPAAMARTYEKGFTCRLVFYMKYAFLFFGILGAASAIAWWYGNSRPEPWWTTALSLGHVAIFVSVNLALFSMVSLLNRPNLTNPTGCWAMWREVNEQHVSRMIREERKLESIVCFRHSDNASLEKDVE